ncbi:MAG: hypothetical protein ACI8RP_000345 [Urechidicola sp.]|jgi:hypothetical protein
MAKAEQLIIFLLNDFGEVLNKNISILIFSNGGMELYNGIEEYLKFHPHERGHQSSNYNKPAEIFYGKKTTYISIVVSHLQILTGKSIF